MSVGPNDPVRLADIIPLAFPSGGMTSSGLRREAQRGHLEIMRIAGKDFTTLAAIEEMKRKCLVRKSHRDSGSGPLPATERQHGSSSMEASNTAQAALKAMWQELSER